VLVPGRDREALKQIEAIAAVEGIDGVFIRTERPCRRRSATSATGAILRCSDAIQDAAKKIKKAARRRHPHGRTRRRPRSSSSGLHLRRIGAYIGLLAKNADALRSGSSRVRKARTFEARAVVKRQTSVQWQNVPRANFNVPARRAVAGALRHAMAGAGRGGYITPQPNGLSHPISAGTINSAGSSPIAAGRLAARSSHRRPDARLPRPAPACAAARRPRRRRGEDLARGHVAARIFVGKLDDPLPYALPIMRWRSGALFAR